jgi:predicted Zn-dependent peptidase
MGANYRAGSMLLIASGAVNHAELVAMAQEKFASLPSGETPKPRAAVYGGGDVRVNEDLEQAHLTYAFPGVSSSDADFYVAQAYVMALGGGMSSRLFQEVREKRGLAIRSMRFRKPPPTADRSASMRAPVKKRPKRSPPLLRVRWLRSLRMQRKRKSHAPRHR